MKNKILHSILFGALTVFALTSCQEETTAGYDKITYYAKLEMSGDATMLLPKGEAYVEPGVIGTIDGEEVTVDIAGAVNSSVPGPYRLTYSVTNADGFMSSTSRTVIVYDTAESPLASGYYTVGAGSKRTTTTSGAVTAFSGYSILIYQESPGVFYCSDFLGGYYDVRAGYGSAYAMTGHFTLNADNTITEGDDLYVAGWNDTLDDWSNASLDPATGTITWDVAYAANYVWTVVLNK
jgi:hypothetical protein